MSNYFLLHDEELTRAGMQMDEIAIYTGTQRAGLRDGPSTNDRPSNAYVYWRQEEGIQELDANFQGNELTVSAHEDHYIFLRNKAGNYIQQVSGPARPVVIGNIGAEAIRVNTLLGKFLLPAGTVLRLDRDAPLQREKKKVLLTFSDKTECKHYLKSALILEGEHWRPLNICAGFGRLKVKDGPFTVQVLALDSYGRKGRRLGDVTLKDPPFDPDYEIYFRSTADMFDPGFKICFTGAGMRGVGLTRVHHSFYPDTNVIYDLQRLRQAPTTWLRHRCIAQLPGLEELDGGSGDGPHPE